MTASRIETLAEGVTLYAQDCLYALRDLDSNSIDACVTDPPYELKFMGKKWDGTGIAFQRDTWERVFRVLKPGAHLLAFGGTRTYHRMACAIEDAGFEIRDSIQWLYGSGFPKSLDVSKAIDKAAGAEREVVGVREYAGGHVQRSSDDKLAPPIGTFVRSQDDRIVSAPATDAARAWEGFGTALKPACEPIVLARKPLSESTVAANVLKWGTGALNIDGCRVATAPDDDIFAKNPHTHGGFGHANAQIYGDGQGSDYRPRDGRWPANVIHDGSEEVVGAFPESQSSAGNKGTDLGIQGGRFASGERGERIDKFSGFDDSGSAARFFYTAKADSDDRLGSKHPTVKPLDLMQYLVRLVTPPKGLVLDPFAGTGTTGEAAIREGMRAILIEREPEYQNDIRRRMSLAMSGMDTRKRVAAQARYGDKPFEAGTLFAQEA